MKTEEKNAWANYFKYAMYTLNDTAEYMGFKNFFNYAMIPFSIPQFITVFFSICIKLEL